MIRSLIASGVFRPAAHTPREGRLKPLVRRGLPVLVGLTVIATGAALFSDGGSRTDRPHIEPIRSVHEVNVGQVLKRKAGLSADVASALARATKATATAIPAAPAVRAPPPAGVGPPAGGGPPATPPPPPPP